MLFFTVFILNSSFAQNDQECTNDKTCDFPIRTDVGEPKIGDIYRDSLKVSRNIKFILPEGTWKINNVTEYKGDTSWRETWSSITLINLNKNSPLKLVILDYFRNTQSWQGWWVPCDKPTLFPASMKILHKNSASVYDSCLIAFPWRNGLKTLNELKNHDYWKNELKNIPDSFLNNSNSSSTIINFEFYHRKKFGLNLRQVVLVDTNIINIDELKLFAYFKLFNDKTNESEKTHSNENEYVFMNWFSRYYNNTKEVYLEGKNVAYDYLNLPTQNLAVKNDVPTLTENEIPIQPPVLYSNDLASATNPVSPPVVQEKNIEAKTQSNIKTENNLNDAKSVNVKGLNNRKALIFGNDNYLHVPKLKNAKADAQAISKVLESLGYKVFYKSDLSINEMKKFIRQFKNDVEGGDEVVFFYAGHGVQIGSTNYLLPIDISADSEEQIKDDGIPLQRILDDMNDRKVRLTLAMVDACRDNPFIKNGRAIGGRGLAPTAAATGQMIIFSAGTGQQALDKLGSTDKDPNGLFTRILIKEINSKGVRIDNVIREVRKKVVEAAKSVGHEQVPAIYDQVIGDFYFNP